MGSAARKSGGRKAMTLRRIEVALQRFGEPSPNGDHADARFYLPLHEQLMSA
jgi:hypothetical protein